MTGRAINFGVFRHFFWENSAGRATKKFWWTGDTELSPVLLYVGGGCSKKYALKYINLHHK